MGPLNSSCTIAGSRLQPLREAWGKAAEARSSAAIPRSVIPTRQPASPGLLMPASTTAHCRATQLTQWWASTHLQGCCRSKELLMAVQVLCGKNFHRVTEKALDKVLICTECAGTTYFLATPPPVPRGQTHLSNEHPGTRVAWAGEL